MRGLIGLCALLLLLSPFSLGQQVVPAIQHKLHVHSREYACVRWPYLALREDGSEESWSSGIPDSVMELHLPECTEKQMDNPGTRTQWTCADKSRVLLTTEEGEKICVKF
jgi:hypothetical protein